MNYKLTIVREKDLECYATKEIKITSPVDVVRAYGQVFESFDREKFAVLHLNTKNVVMAIEYISTGSLNSSIAHPREVFKGAILNNSASIIIAHNHPSGETQPSSEDKSITRRLQDCGDILDIKVLDSLIICSENRYLSFKEENLM